MMIEENKSIAGNVEVDRRKELQQQLRSVRQILHRNVVLPEEEHKALLAQEDSLARELAQARKAFRKQAVNKASPAESPVEDAAEGEISKEVARRQARIEARKSKQIQAKHARKEAKKAAKQAGKEARKAARKASRMEEKVKVAETSDTCDSDDASIVNEDVYRAVVEQKKRAQELKRVAEARKEELKAARQAWIKARKAANRARKEARKSALKEEKTSHVDCLTEVNDDVARSAQAARREARMKKRVAESKAEKEANKLARKESRKREREANKVAKKAGNADSEAKLVSDPDVPDVVAKEDSPVGVTHGEAPKHDVAGLDDVTAGIVGLSVKESGLEARKALRRQENRRAKKLERIVARKAARRLEKKGGGKDNEKAEGKNDAKVVCESGAVGSDWEVLDPVAKRSKKQGNCKEARKLARKDAKKATNVETKVVENGQAGESTDDWEDVAVGN